MTEEQIKNTIRGFLHATASGDISKALSFMAEDTEVTVWGRTFKGKAEINKYLTWIAMNSQDSRITETGISIITQGDTGIIEHIISGVAAGGKFAVPAVCIYEIKNNKIQSVRGFSDRLTMARQAASGLFARWMVNSIVRTMEKGM